MSKELVKEEISPEIINSLILTGDMSKLSPAQQTQYYTAVCKSVGINPITQPFAIITLQGKKTLYATKGCTQQLSDTRGISTEIKERKTADTVYIASCRATSKDGRFTDDDGVVSIVGLKGAELGNAMMKAVTKAKRRAVLALCGLGMPDETEVEDMIVQHPASEATATAGKSRVEALVENQVEEAVTTLVKEEVKDETKETKEVKKKDVQKSEKVVKDVEQVQKTKTSSVLPLTVQGIIEGQPRSGVVDGKTKYLFKIEDKEYGTFDEKIIKEVMDVVDLQQDKPPGILVEFTYKERPSTKTPGKVFYDITGFRQVTIDEVPI